MKRKTSFLSITLIMVAVIMTVFFVGAFAADYDGFAVAIETTRIDEETFNVDVKMYNNPGISGYQLEIEFDNSKVQIVDYSEASCLSAAGSIYNVQEGDAPLSSYSKFVAVVFRAGNSTVDGSLANVTFRLCEGVSSAEIKIGKMLFSNEKLKEVSVEDTVSALDVERIIPDYHGKCGDNVNYELYLGTGLLKIEGTGDMYSYEIGDTPWYSYKDFIKEITISNGVTSICKYAFSSCEGIESITIPESIAVIGDNAFQACANLAEIKVDKNNSNYCDIDGVVFSKDKKTLVIYPAGGPSDYTVPSEVAVIYDYAFIRCTGLERIYLPDGLTSIGKSAFSGCKSLQEIVIPAGVTVIAATVFSFCDDLESITFMGDITSIGDMAFAYCSSLKSLTIPAEVEYIGDLAFEWCISLRSVIFESQNVVIGEMVDYEAALSTIYCYRNSTADAYFAEARYTKIYFDTYTVTYNTNGGAGTFEAQTKKDSEDIRLNSAVPTRNGYDFKGWSGSDGKTYAAGDVYSGNENLSLTAIWTPVYVILSYDANGGSVTVPAKDVQYTVAVGDLAVPNRVGYTFTGWFTQKVGGEQIKAETVVNTTENFTVYAHWTANTYKITFDANGGECNTAHVNVTFDSTYGELPTPTRAYYIFDGWYFEKAFENKLISGNKVVITANHTVYAK